MIVLIVEDNPGVRRLLRQVVGAAATGIWECEDGADALAAYEDHQPDVVLMDVRMPRMDGLTATKQILHAHPNACVIMVTDFDDDALRKAARETGASAYALKQDLTSLPKLVASVAQGDTSWL